MESPRNICFSPLTLKGT